MLYTCKPLLLVAPSVNEISFCLLFMKLLLSLNCSFRILLHKHCQFCFAICSFASLQTTRVFFCYDIVMGGGDTSRRRLKHTTAITVNSIYELGKSCLSYRFLCDLCYFSYVQVFKIRQDMEITASLAGALRTASYCCFFTASAREGQGEGFKWKAAKVVVTLLRV